MRLVLAALAGERKVLFLHHFMSGRSALGAVTCRRERASSLAVAATHGLSPSRPIASPYFNSPSLRQAFQLGHLSPGACR